MSLRAKLLLAQMPLAFALVLVGVVAVWSVSVLGERSQLILQDNYRSVLAAQRMKESIERLDSAAMFILVGELDVARPQIAEHLKQFESELKSQEANITEPGEQEATMRLRRAWNAYQNLLEEYQAIPDAGLLNLWYFQALQPQFQLVKDAADKILDINQDAMVNKADSARRWAKDTNSAVIAVAIGALVVGLYSSIALTNRLLRPLSILTHAVTRLGQKDFSARALVKSRDEIGGLAAQFNSMAEHLQEYRNSSLGELLLAQRASQATIDSIPDPVIVFDTEGNILNMNSEAAPLWRNGQGESAVKSLLTLPPEVRTPLQRARDHVLQGKGPYFPAGFEDAFGVEAPSGERWFLLRATPIYEENGRVAGATAIFQDVTRLRRLDELKNNLVATVAHEFRTPLTSLRMAVHLCLEGVAGQLTDKQADLLHAAREECERLQSTVDELLDLARIQSGGVRMERVTVSAAALIDDAVATFRGVAADKRINLQGESLLIHDNVSADLERIQIVFSNLIANAVRHTPEQGIVRVRGMEIDGAVRFEISDTGEGIPKVYHEAIFDRFFRVPGTSAGAAGLGLSLCKEIVGAHGGQVGVESEPGHGATFWFTLPTVADGGEKEGG